MWIFVMAALGTAAVVFYGYLLLVDSNLKPAWGRARSVSVPSVAAARMQSARPDLAQGVLRMSNEGDTYFPTGGGKKLPADPDRRAQALNELWVESDYYWVVVCKNDRFHQTSSIYYKHHIALGETDSVQSRPLLNGPFLVTCDECGKEVVYQPSDVLKCEMKAPSAFVPHPLFQS